MGEGSIKSPHFSIHDQLLHISRLVRRTKLVVGIIDRCTKHLQCACGHFVISDLRMQPADLLRTLQSPARSCLNSSMGRPFVALQLRLGGPKIPNEEDGLLETRYS